MRSAATAQKIDEQAHRGTEPQREEARRGVEPRRWETHPGTAPQRQKACQGMAPQRPSPAERHRAECERLSLAERDRLVLDFMPLARRVAHRYAAPLQREDLEQVAFLALVKAAERYDPAHRTSFPAYAIPTIVGEIKHFLRDHTWDLHVPRQVQERALLVTRASDELAGRLGRAPTIRELAEQLALSTSDVLEALEAAAARDARSLDAPVERADGEGADTAAMGLMGHEDLGLELALERADLRRALARLSPEQREVIVLRFFADLTQSQIARRVGVSQMQVSRILRRALAAMREFAGLQEPDAATINRPGG